MMKFRQQQGGVSIFIVVFTALLLTVVTASFVQVMIRNQQQATTNDLSQSAYDAALAGVEDAKRALVKLANCGDDCSAIENAFERASDECEFLGTSGINVATFTNGEVAVDTDPNNSQEAAYTCVKVKMDSDDVRGSLEANSGGEVIRLKGTDVFDKVRISWFRERDLANQGAPLQLVARNDLLSLPGMSSAEPWSGNTPSLLRAQLIQFRKGNIDLREFSESGSPNARTAFLYPNVINDGDPSVNNGDTGAWANDQRLDDGDDFNAPTLVECDVANSATYFCSAVIGLPSGIDRDDREAYLQLAALYNPTGFMVELLDDDGDVVPFDGQQATVDSTGRAANLFRRVSARVSVRSASLPYPDAALTIKGDLCKDFAVTNERDTYTPSSCRE